MYDPEAPSFSFGGSDSSGVMAAFVVVGIVVVAIVGISLVSVVLSTARHAREIAEKDRHDDGSGFSGEVSIDERPSLEAESNNNEESISPPIEMDAAELDMAPGASTDSETSSASVSSTEPETTLHSDSDVSPVAETPPPMSMASEPATEPILDSTPVPVSETENERFREWTSSDGLFRIQAEFMSRIGSVIKLRKENGEVIEVPLEKLSIVDQVWVQHYRPRKK
jgi:hypothetical protein